nr:histone deacetylase 14 [Tanacetum cinerariifolium]
MADVNAPSVCADDQILPHIRFHPRPDSPLHLPNEEPVLGYLKFSAKGTKREVFGMPIPGSLITAKIQEASYYQEYLAKATKTSDKPPKAKKSKHGWVADKDADYQKALEESMKTAYALPQGPLPPVVIREPESGKYQPLSEVPGKGKAKVTEEQVTHDLLSLQKPKKKSPADDEETKKVVLGATPGGNDEDQAGPDPGAQDEGQARPDPGAQADDQTGSDASAQDECQVGSNPNETSEGQAGSNPDEPSEGQAGPDPGDAEAKVQYILSHVVYVGSDREHMDLDVVDVSSQPSTEQLDEGFTATAYPKVQESLKLAVGEQVLLEEPASSSRTLYSLQHLSRDFSFGDQFFNDKPSDADKNAETEVESMVNVTIQQALSLIFLMISPIIDLTSRPESPKEHQQLKATTTNTTTTTTITLPPPQAQQQSTVEAMMVKHIGELEHIMANLIQMNKEMEESEVVMDAVDWAMQAPLQNRFRDLPEADMKEILHQLIWETESYKSHEDHMQLFEAFEKSMNHDHSDELAQDLAEARKKKKKSRESPKTPPGSLSHQPPPPPPPARPSRASRAPGAFGSQDWWKPFEEERPATPETAWSISSSDMPVPTNNWASALTSNYLPLPEDLLFAQTGDIAIFMDWFCKRRGITELKPQDL